MTPKYETRQKSGKKRITIRIDDHLIDWFKEESTKGGGSYQNRINEALNIYYQQQTDPNAHPVRQIIREEFSRYTVQAKKQLLHRIDDLPPVAMAELANFVEYLFFKNNDESVSSKVETSFLYQIIGIGESDETDISERDEEILKNELGRINQGV